MPDSVPGSWYNKGRKWTMSQIWSLAHGRHAKGNNSTLQYNTVRYNKTFCTVVVVAVAVVVVIVVVSSRIFRGSILTFTWQCCSLAKSCARFSLKGRKGGEIEIVNSYP